VGPKAGLDGCGKSRPQRDFFFLVTFIKCFMLHSLYILLYDDNFKCVETLRLHWLSYYFADVVFHVSYPCLASARQLCFPSSSMSLK